MRTLHALQREMLILVADFGEPCGQDIKRELEAYHGDELRSEQLYHHLDSLCERGLVEKRRADGRTNAYILTEDGRRWLEKQRHWVAEHAGPAPLDEGS
ncbi:transcriptional regulator, PadR family [Halarchaeum acidiphilum MH1-52-1]|uniref:Transcriptional regulator, PadR family n=1 Tax=Halarchaeum acidiphilum MH1-52-1 TaxID=1261545 RepID=U2YXU2_9EURY|nr:helix-turn-helix transcriptional regulator [Halarchaeum acidiphilum]GAD53632.1 transcriptional regulator, PadR family [Halarchaeum acidiphilum MH1-52-1]